MSIDDQQAPLAPGVLGGMGPQATVDFMHEVIARTPASRDQEHLRMLVDCNGKVPDRQAAMRGNGKDVATALKNMAVGLENLGADFLVMPCNTAHAFIDDAVAAVSIPFVSIIDVTLEAAAAAGASNRIGLLATDACLAAGLYQRAAGSLGLELLLPDENEQLECMRCIAAVKSGDTGAGVRARMSALAESLIASGAGVLIAGCTEIPLVLEGDVRGVPLISSTDELAQRTVDLALRRLPLQA